MFKTETVGAKFEVIMLVAMTVSLLGYKAI
jgi:hypothetical protein